MGITGDVKEHVRRWDLLSASEMLQIISKVGQHLT